jgi:hypothetical protein
MVALLANKYARAYLSLYKEKKKTNEWFSINP